MPIDTQAANFQSKVRALRCALAARGYDARDFDVLEDHHSPLASLFQLAGGVLIVRRRSTGEERFYATDGHSPWLESVMADLDLGHLSDRVDTRPSYLAHWPSSESAGLVDGGCPVERVSSQTVRAVQTSAE